MNRFAGVMTYLVVIGVLGMTGLTRSWAQTGGETEQELLSLEQEWATARINGDAAFLERFLAREFRIITAHGSIVERDADIAVFASRTAKPESITHEDMKVSVYGDVGVVTGRENVKGTYKGVPGEFAIRFMNVFVRRDGRWQMVAAQGTSVAETRNGK